MSIGVHTLLSSRAYLSSILFVVRKIVSRMPKTIFRENVCVVVLGEWSSVDECRRHARVESDSVSFHFGLGCVAVGREGVSSEQAVVNFGIRR